MLNFVNLMPKAFIYWLKLFQPTFADRKIELMEKTCYVGWNNRCSAWFQHGDLQMFLIDSRNSTSTAPIAQWLVERLSCNLKVCSLILYGGKHLFWLEKKGYSKVSFGMYWTTLGFDSIISVLLPNPRKLRINSKYLHPVRRWCNTTTTRHT